MAIQQGQVSIGLTSGGLADSSDLLPPSMSDRTVSQHLDHLLSKVADLEIVVERKADADKLKSLIAISDELIQIQAEDIVLVGDVTIAQLIKEQNGSVSPSLPASITRIIGDRIETGVITSNNWSTTQGTAIDLDNETIHFGGSSNPKLYFDGTDLFIDGTINAGVIQSTGWGISEGLQIDLDNETITAGGSSSPKLYYDGAGNLSLTGAINTNSTIAGTNAGTVVSNAANGYNIQQQLEVSGSTVLAGTIEPANTGGVKVGSITWNSTTGALTGGSGIAITEYGIIGAQSGSATFTIVAATGSSTWAGDISTAGQVIATGSSSSGGYIAAIVGNTTSGSTSGVIGSSTSGFGVGGYGPTGLYGYSTSGRGLWAISTSFGSYGADIENVGGGVALKVRDAAEFDDTVDIASTLTVTGTGDFNSVVDIASTLTVGGVSTFNNNVNIQNNSTLNVDRSVFVATDETSGASSLVLGNATATGQNTLVINEGAAGSQRTNEFHFYGALSSDSDTTLGMVLEQNVSSGLSPSPTHRIPIFINSTEYWLYLEAR